MSLTWLILHISILIYSATTYDLHCLTWSLHFPQLKGAIKRSSQDVLHITGKAGTSDLVLMPSKRAQ